MLPIPLQLLALLSVEPPFSLTAEMLSSGDQAGVSEGYDPGCGRTFLRRGAEPGTGGASAWEGCLL